MSEKKRRNPFPSEEELIEQDYKYISAMARSLGKSEADIADIIDYKAIKEDIEKGYDSLGTSNRNIREFYPDLEPLSFNDNGSSEEDTDIELSDSDISDIQDYFIKEMQRENDADDISSKINDDPVDIPSFSRPSRKAKTPSYSATCTNPAKENSISSDKEPKFPEIPLEDIASKMPKKTQSDIDELLDASDKIDTGVLPSLTKDNTEETPIDLQLVETPQAQSQENPADKPSNGTPESDDTSKEPAKVSAKTVPTGKKKKKKRRRLKPIPRLIANVVIAIAVVQLLKLTGILMLDKVSGSSMVPNYTDGDLVITTNLTEIERYDVVTAVSPEGTPLIKRVIGLPGDTITYKNSHVYVNGTMTAEDFIASSDGISLSLSGDVVLGEDEYFLCGDNREYSKDSRSFGAITKSDIMGEVIFHVGLPF